MNHQHVPEQKTKTEVTIPIVNEKLIEAKRSYDRWYVYFQGVPPKENVGCGCKTAKSAMHYMHLLKARYGATISQNIYEQRAHRVPPPKDQAFLRGTYSCPLSLSGFRLE